MSVETFGPSPTWSRMSAEVGRDLQRGVPWRDIHQLHIAVNMADEKAYEYYQARLEAKLWQHNKPNVLELGPGYGAMARYYPDGTQLWCVDLPEMLELQRRHHGEAKALMRLHDIMYVPVAELATVPLDGLYLVSTWALTETTRAIWEYFIANAGKLAGAYVLGYRQWADEKEPWPWEQLAEQFDEFELEPDDHFPYSDSLELIGRNRVR